MPRVKIGRLKTFKIGSSITKTMRDASDRLYDAFLRDPNPSKRHGIFDRVYTVFVKATSKEFEKMAAKIYRRWPLPEAVEPQDVMQDLHCEIVRIMKAYRPEKAQVADYLVWNAFARAKKECNRQRGKVKDREQSIHALTISSLTHFDSGGGSEQFEDCIDRLAQGSDASELDRECESMLDSKNMLRKMRKHLSKQDRRYVYRIVLNYGNIRQTAFNMISAVEEMDETQREAAVKRKTKKLMTALRNAATVWTRLKEQERGKDRQEERSEEQQTERDVDVSDRSTGSDVRESVGRRVVATSRNRRSQIGLESVGSKRTADRRQGIGSGKSACFFLCA